MRIALLSLVLTGLLAGCQPASPTPHTPQNIVPPVVNIQPEPDPVRTDLPTNWFEVKGTNWSFGLPIGFDKLTLGVPAEVVSRHYSLKEDLTIDLSIHASDSDMHDFILHNFMMNRNITIMQIMEKSNGDKTIVAVHSLALPSGKDGALDFFVQKGNLVCQLSCRSTNDNLKQHANTCFNVADTIVLK